SSEDGGANGRAVVLWTAPAAGVGGAVDVELWLTNTAGVVVSRWVVGALKLVGLVDVIIEVALKSVVSLEIVVEEDLEGHGRVTSPLIPAAVVSFICSISKICWRLTSLGCSWKERQ